MTSQSVAKDRRAPAPERLLSAWSARAGFLAVLLCAGPASAHHSFAMFELEKQITVEGIVREFQWTNPHIWIELTVKEGGKDVNFSIEGAAPNTLARRGWTRAALKAGDRITAIVNPLKSTVEGKGGSLVRATFSDGRPVGPPPGAPGAH